MNWKRDKEPRGKTAASDLWYQALTSGNANCRVLDPKGDISQSTWLTPDGRIIGNGMMHSKMAFYAFKWLEAQGGPHNPFDKTRVEKQNADIIKAFGDFGNIRIAKSGVGKSYFLEIFTQPTPQQMAAIQTLAEEAAKSGTFFFDAGGVTGDTYDTLVSVLGLYPIPSPLPMTPPAGGPELTAPPDVGSLPVRAKSPAFKNIYEYLDGLGATYPEYAEDANWRDKVSSALEKEAATDVWKTALGSGQGATFYQPNDNLPSSTWLLRDGTLVGSAQPHGQQAQSALNWMVAQGIIPPNAVPTMGRGQDCITYLKQYGLVRVSTQVLSVYFELTTAPSLQQMVAMRALCEKRHLHTDWFYGTKIVYTWDKFETLTQLQPLPQPLTLNAAQPPQAMKPQPEDREGAGKNYPSMYRNMYEYLDSIGAKYPEYTEDANWRDKTAQARDIWTEALRAGDGVEGLASLDRNSSAWLTPSGKVISSEDIHGYLAFNALQWLASHGGPPNIFKSYQGSSYQKILNIFEDYGNIRISVGGRMYIGIELRTAPTTAQLSVLKDVERLVENPSCFIVDMTGRIAKGYDDFIFKLGKSPLPQPLTLPQTSSDAGKAAPLQQREEAPPDTKVRRYPNQYANIYEYLDSIGAKYPEYAEDANWRDKTASANILKYALLAYLEGMGAEYPSDAPERPKQAASDIWAQALLASDGRNTTFSINDHLPYSTWLTPGGTLIGGTEIHPQLALDAVYWMEARGGPSVPFSPYLEDREHGDINQAFMDYGNIRISAQGGYDLTLEIASQPTQAQMSVLQDMSHDRAEDFYFDAGGYQGFGYTELKDSLVMHPLHTPFTMNASSPDAPPVREIPSEEPATLKQRRKDTRDTSVLQYPLAYKNIHEYLNSLGAEYPNDGTERPKTASVDMFKNALQKAGEHILSPRDALTDVSFWVLSDGTMIGSEPSHHGEQVMAAYRILEDEGYITNPFKPHNLMFEHDYHLQGNTSGYAPHEEYNQYLNDEYDAYVWGNYSEIIKSFKDLGNVRGFVDTHKGTMLLEVSTQPTPSQMSALHDTYLAHENPRMTVDWGGKTLQTDWAGFEDETQLFPLPTPLSLNVSPAPKFSRPNPGKVDTDQLYHELAPMRIPLRKEDTRDPAKLQYPKVYNNVYDYLDGLGAEYPNDGTERPKTASANIFKDALLANPHNHVWDAGVANGVSLWLLTDGTLIGGADIHGEMASEAFQWIEAQGIARNPLPRDEEGNLIEWGDDAMFDLLPSPTSLYQTRVNMFKDYGNIRVSIYLPTRIGFELSTQPTMAQMTVMETLAQRAVAVNLNPLWEIGNRVVRSWDAFELELQLTHLPQPFTVPTAGAAPSAQGGTPTAGAAPLQQRTQKPETRDTSKLQYPKQYTSIYDYLDGMGAEYPNDGVERPKTSRVGKHAFLLANPSLQAWATPPSTYKEAMRRLSEETAPLYKSASDLIRNSEPFQQWFGDSRVRDEEGNPKVVYRGDYRGDVLNQKGYFDPKKNTSGRFYFTEDPEVAGNYALSKDDKGFAEEIDEDNGQGWYYANRFKFPKWRHKGERNAPNLQQLWYRLSPEEKERVKDVLSKWGWDDDTYDMDFTGKNPQHPLKDYENLATNYGQAHTWEGVNFLKGMHEALIGGGEFIGDRLRGYGDILKAMGLDHEYTDPYQPASTTTPAYLGIHNPLVTSEIPSDLPARLRALLKNDRTRVPRNGAPASYSFAKADMTPKEWLDYLDDAVSRVTPDEAQGTLDTHGDMVWTTLPDKVVDALKTLGYDGIKDVSDRREGNAHAIWIAFEPDQIHSSLHPRVLAKGEKPYDIGLPKLPRKVTKGRRP